MADKKKPNYSDIIKFEVKGLEGPPVLRGNASDEEWASIIERAKKKYGEESIREVKVPGSGEMIRQTREAVARPAGAPKKKQPDVVMGEPEITMETVAQPELKVMGDRAASAPKSESPLSGPNALDAARAVVEAAGGTVSGVKEYFKDARSVPVEESRAQREANTPQSVKDINARRDQTAAEATNTLKLLATPYAARAVEAGGLVKQLGELDKSQMLQDLGSTIQSGAVSAITPSPVPGAPPNLPTALEAGSMGQGALASTPASIPAPTEAEIAAGMSLPRDAAGNVIPPPAETPMPEGAVVPADVLNQPPAGAGMGTGAGMSVSSSVKTKKPGIVGAPGAVIDPTQEIRDLAAQQKAIYEEGASIAETKSKAEERALRSGMARQAQLEKENLERQALVERTIADREQALTGLQNEVRELGRQGVDPNRFWNNKSDGQKAAAVIAGALFGFSGQGMQWLQRLDGLVRDDVQQQMADRQFKAGQLDKAIGLQNNLIGLAEKRGLRGASAYEAAVAAAKSNVADQLRMLSTQFGRPEMRLKAEQMALEADMAAQQHIEKFQRQSRLDAAELSVKYAQEANLRSEMQDRRVSMALKMQEARGGPKMQEVKGPTAMELGALKAAAKVATDLRSKFGTKNVISRFLDKPEAIFPNTEADKYNIARDQAINIIAPMLGAGVLQAHDLKRWENLMAKAGDMAGEEKLKILVKDIYSLYNEKRNTLAATGFDVSQLPPLSMPVDFTPSR